MSEAEIQAIYRETIDALYGYVSRRCGGDRCLAEDVTQEAWLRAVADWRAKGAPENPLAWLTTVARNLLLNQLRRQQPVPLDTDDIPAPDDRARNGTVRLVNDALARLPRRDARLLEAFHFDGFRIARIAQETGLSERAVEGRLRRARLQLRRQLNALFKSQEGTHD